MNDFQAQFDALKPEDKNLLRRYATEVLDAFNSGSISSSDITWTLTAEWKRCNSNMNELVESALTDFWIGGNFDGS